MKRLVSLKLGPKSLPSEPLGLQSGTSSSHSLKHSLKNGFKDRCSTPPSAPHGLQSRTPSSHSLKNGFKDRCSSPCSTPHTFKILAKPDEKLGFLQSRTSFPHLLSSSLLRSKKRLRMESKVGLRLHIRPKKPPRRTQDASKTPQDAPKTPQDAPRRAQEAPKTQLRRQQVAARAYFGPS